MNVVTSKFALIFDIAQKGAINIPVLQHLVVLFQGGIVSRHTAKDVWAFRIRDLKRTDTIINYFEAFPLKSKKI